MRMCRYAAIAALSCACSWAVAATYGELAESRGPGAPGGVQVVTGAPSYVPPRPTGQLYPGYVGGPQMMPGYGMTGTNPGTSTTARFPTTMPYLPSGTNGLPTGRQINWTYGQVNASSDPFNIYGLSTPYMFVPWTTPLSGWANAQSWDWWRSRTGDSGPSLPLW
jgi:hypothetical protein